MCVRMPLALACNNWQPSDRYVSTEVCPAVSGVWGEGPCTQETGQWFDSRTAYIHTKDPLVAGFLPVSLIICSFASFFLSFFKNRLALFILEQF